MKPIFTFPPPRRRLNNLSTQNPKNLSKQTEPPQTIDFRLLFSYAWFLMAFEFGITARKIFVVTCKKCRRDVPSGREEFPFQSITVECPRCSELRRYLPSEVFLGRPDQLVIHRQRAGVP
jgi:hypothetical protein